MKHLNFKFLIFLLLFAFAIGTVKARKESISKEGIDNKGQRESVVEKNANEKGKKEIYSRNFLYKYEMILNQALNARNKIRKRLNKSRSEMERKAQERKLISVDMRISKIEEKIARIESGKLSPIVNALDQIEDDPYEENDDMASAAAITTGTYDNLVYLDEDWYKVYITAASVGKDLKVNIKGTSYPDPNVRKDLDFAIIDDSGKMLAYALSGSDDETIYISDIAEGWYYIGIIYFSQNEAIYSMTVEVGNNFGIGYISGRVTDTQGQGIESIYVELYGDPFDWDVSRPLITTDSNGDYKIGYEPGDYNVLFNILDFNHNYEWTPDPNYIGEYYDNKSSSDEADIVSITADNTNTGINAVLLKGGTISGKLKDPNGVVISAWHGYAKVYDLNGNFISNDSTDENGDYLIERIPIGNFKIQLYGNDKNYKWYATEWYNDKACFADADILNIVEEGKAITGIDAQLSDGGYITGRVTDSSGTGIGNVKVYAYDTSFQIRISSYQTNTEGYFSVNRMPTSNAKVFFNTSIVDYASEWYDDKGSFDDADLVPTTAGETTPDIDAILTEGSADTIVITSPNGGENWQAGTSHNITWTTTGTVYNVKIEYSIDNGTGWNDVVAIANNDGINEWTVPDTPSTQCLLRISDAWDGIPSDTSDAVFTITASVNPPQINLSRTTLFFGTNGSSETKAQSFLISNTGGGSLNWIITDDAAWLSCTPTSGTGTTTVTVSADPSGLSAGTYNGTVTVTDPNATNSPQTISVTFKVYNAGSTSLPFGSFDTPINNSDVFGSVPVTGWALDDIEVETLLVKREPVASDAPGVIGADGLVLIGSAVFVEGARPDVEAAYPTYPLNYRAGWGYMLLTNALPDGGNGTFVLHAIAYDKDGHKVDLGTKTINVDNASSVMPFGAIDTPHQGGEASGASFVNFGWALTPVPNTIVNGATSVNVLIDGVIKGNATYGDYRVDIESKYPGYNNSGGAGGHFYIDTTTYANGVHTISWHVRDDASNLSGIGSRFFSIVNTSSGSTQQKITSTMRYIGEDEIKDYQKDYGAISIKRGFDKIEEPEEKYTDDKGYYRVEMREIERVVIELNREEENTIYEGYMKVGKELRRLPIGSTLDKQKGVFYWEPGPGFIGEYELVFIDKVNKIRKNIKILIKPKFEKRIVE